MPVLTIIVIAIIVLLFSLGITAAICIYVYRDAKRRDMSPSLWTIVTFLTPGYIGFIIYLIVRNGREITSLKCPSCDSKVDKSYFVCPYCSEPLKAKCTSCGNALEAGWDTCPFCGEQIPEENRLSPSLNSKPTDRALSTILILIIIIPLILIVLAVVAGNIFMFNAPNYSEMLQEFALDINIEISDKVSDIYSAQLVIYSDDQLIEATTVSDADRYPLREVVFYSDTSGADRFQLVFNDKNGNVLLKTEIFDVTPDSSGCFELNGVLIRSSTGELSLICE